MLPLEVAPRASGLGPDGTGRKGRVTPETLLPRPIRGRAKTHTATDMQNLSLEPEQSSAIAPEHNGYQ